MNVWVYGFESKCLRRGMCVGGGVNSVSRGLASSSQASYSWCLGVGGSDLTTELVGVLQLGPAEFPREREQAVLGLKLSGSVCVLNKCCVQNRTLTLDMIRGDHQWKGRMPAPVYREPN